MSTDLEQIKVMLSFIAIISSLFGVFVGTLITAYFAERREKKKLIKDLQIKAYEELLLLCNDYKDKLYTACAIISTIPSGINKIKLKELLDANTQLYIPNKKIGQSILLKSNIFHKLNLNCITMNFAKLDELLYSNIQSIIILLKESIERNNDQSNLLFDLCKKNEEYRLRLVEYINYFIIALQNESLSGIFPVKKLKKKDKQALKIVKDKLYSQPL